MLSEAYQQLVRNTPDGRASVPPLTAAKAEIGACVPVVLMNPVVTGKRRE
jgi:hypothetical protein